jgi:mRNA interferase HicA
VTSREAAAKRRRLGCEEVRRRGSHRRWVNPATGGRATLPDWGPHDLKVGTLRAAVRELRIDGQAFEEALADCGRTGQGWRGMSAAGDDVFVKLKRDPLLWCVRKLCPRIWTGYVECSPTSVH